MAVRHWCFLYHLVLTDKVVLQRGSTTLMLFVPPSSDWQSGAATWQYDTDAFVPPSSDWQRNDWKKNLACRCLCLYTEVCSKDSGRTQLYLTLWRGRFNGWLLAEGLPAKFSILGWNGFFLTTQLHLQPYSSPSISRGGRKKWNKTACILVVFSLGWFIENLYITPTTGFRGNCWADDDTPDLQQQCLWSDCWPTA